MIRVAAAAVLLVVTLAPSVSGQQPGSDGAEALFAEGDSLMRMGRLQQARDRFEQVIDEFPRDRYPDLVWRAAARVRLADLRWRSGAEELAGAGYTDVLDEEPPSVWTSRAMLGLGAVALAGGDWMGAADLLQRVVSAVDAGEPEADPASAGEARDRLTLLDRFKIMVLDGGRPWTGSGTVLVRGLELDRPVALAASADGQLLVVDEGIPAVLLVDAERTRANRLAFNEHSRPWWGADGLPYLPTRKAGVIALGGSRVGFLANEEGRAVPLKELRAGVRAGSGRWYLLDADPDRVLRFGSEGDFQGTATARGEEPVDVAIDARGRLHVLDRATNTVTRYGVDDRTEEILLRGNWRRPEAIEVDGLGNIYVLDRDARTIDVFDESGARVAQVGPTLPGGVQLRGPRDISVDGAGRLYVADRSASAIVVLR